MLTNKTYVIAGKNNIAVDVLCCLINTIGKSQIKVVLNLTDNYIDGWQMSLGKFARDNLIEIIQLDSCYDIRNLIFLSLEFDKIVKVERFKPCAKLFNIHFSKLPSYKGMYTSIMPILNNEVESGVTLHFIDNGVDTGNIVDQVIFPISELDTASDLYRKYIYYGTMLVINNLSKITQNITGYPQGINGSSYYSKKVINFDSIHIDLCQTAQNILNQIRGYCFRVYQLPTIFGVQVFGAKVLYERSTIKAGHILREDVNSFTISSIDFNVMIFKDRFEEFILAIMNNDIATTKHILDNPFVINERSVENGWSPLMVAAYNNHFEVVSILLRSGADVNLVNYRGTTPLMYAKDAWIRSGNSRIFDLLLKHGANHHVKDFSGLSIWDYIKENSHEYEVQLKEKINTIQLGS